MSTETCQYEIQRSLLQELGYLLRNVSHREPVANKFVPTRRVLYLSQTLSKENSQQNKQQTDLHDRDTIHNRSIPDMMSKMNYGLHRDSTVECRSGVISEIPSKSNTCFFSSEFSLEIPKSILFVKEIYGSFWRN